MADPDQAYLFWQHTSQAWAAPAGSSAGESDHLDTHNITPCQRPESAKKGRRLRWVVGYARRHLCDVVMHQACLLLSALSIDLPPIDLQRDGQDVAPRI